MLAVQLGRELHREVLIDRIWPDVPIDVALHRLHAAASTLRKALAEVPGAVLRRQGEAYQLVIPGAELDVATFEEALREAARARGAGDTRTTLAQLRVALDAYGGDLLPEAGPAEWVVGERDRLRLAAASAACSAADLARGRRSSEHPPEVALAWARRATELDPLRQSAWKLLAEVQSEMGDDAAAAGSWRTAGRVGAELMWR
jgi:two-component SAPR family response regulator